MLLPFLLMVVCREAGGRIDFADWTGWVRCDAYGIVIFVTTIIRVRIRIIIIIIIVIISSSRIMIVLLCSCSVRRRVRRERHRAARPGGAAPRRHRVGAGAGLRAGRCPGAALGLRRRPLQPPPRRRARRPRRVLGRLHSAKRGVVGGGCSGWGWYYIAN